MSVPFRELPTHIREIQLVGWKPWIIMNTLEDARLNEYVRNYHKQYRVAKKMHSVSMNEMEKECDGDSDSVSECAVSDEPHVLWLDAGLEVRRPLHEVREAITRDGYFFTTAGHVFPSYKLVRPLTMKACGCMSDSVSVSEFGDAAPANGTHFSV